MPTFQYAKLVRDNIRLMHEQNGDVVTGKVLTTSEHVVALAQKLKEEADELLGAISAKNNDDIASELADISQVLEDLTKLLKANKANIVAVKKRKLQKKGGFTKGQYIDTVQIVHEDDPLIARFRADPAKYPEL